MRQVLKTLPEAGPISLYQLRSSENIPLIAAYRSHNSDAYCVLAKIGKDGYLAGFVPLNGISAPRYTAQNAYDAIEKASGNRKVFIFSSMDEMLKAMANKTF